MNVLRNSVCLVGALALSSCATMEQAPLVYASKASVGVDIATTSTETPGLSMNVGIKLVDAAYVPVAVSKRCYKDAADCSREVQIVSGTAGNRTHNAGDDAASQNLKLKQAIRELETALIASKDAQKTASSAQSEYDKLESLRKKEAGYNQRKAELQELTNKRPSSEAMTAPGFDIAANNAREQKITEIMALEPTTEERDFLSRAPMLDEALDARNKAVAAEKSAADALEKRRAELTAVREALSQQNDSYSVFGSFENKNSGSGKGAEVSLGKIFATGVASQNISRGLEKRYQQRDSIACYEAVKSLAGVDSQKAADLLGRCISLSEK